MRQVDSTAGAVAQLGEGVGAVRMLLDEGGVEQLGQPLPQHAGGHVVAALLQRTEDARRLFERLLELRNDVGLLAEQYDPVSRRQLGNFPQAFSHVGLINTAFNLSPQQTQPARDRRQRR